MAALGRAPEAAAALEAAAAVAHKHELWLLEAFALRDLKLEVLDAIGHGQPLTRLSFCCTPLYL